MGWNINESLQSIPEEGEYINRVESVEVHTPEDTSKFPSLLFKIKIISPEVPDGQEDQAYFRTLNPKWLRFIAKDIANANVVDLSNNDLDPTDYAELARQLDALFSGKLFRYTLTHGTYNGQKSANWSLEAPAASF